MFLLTYLPIRPPDVSQDQWKLMIGDEMFYFPGFIYELPSNIIFRKMYLISLHYTMFGKGKVSEIAVGVKWYKSFTFSFWFFWLSHCLHEPTHLNKSLVYFSFKSTTITDVFCCVTCGSGGGSGVCVCGGGAMSGSLHRLHHAVAFTFFTVYGYLQRALQCKREAVGSRGELWTRCDHVLHEVLFPKHRPVSNTSD